MLLLYIELFSTDEKDSGLALIKQSNKRLKQLCYLLVLGLESPIKSHAVVMVHVVIDSNILGFGQDSRFDS